MGIPKFYRWLSERYPLLNQPVTATAAAPVIDNLYLDMNGIIHNCTHGNDPNVKLTEEEMILRIFAYLDKLVQIIKPRKLLCMAIDGVAPRAKMNQQRARRFRTGRDREEAEKAAAARGEPLSKDRFDSNCITPGTPFMARLGEHLRFFVRMKTSTDQTWKSMKVLFSGHEVPGEGEHKIMEYIRLQKKNPGYKPNQRHCLYGLDADLIMLSLVTHEPHFCLLREVVSYSGNNRGQPAREVLENPCAEHFILFQIGLMREYLQLEFANVKLPFKLDIERVIDDFVLFCMLVGNDFLPALPTLDISEGALNKLLDVYIKLLPELGGYLTYGGELDRTRLERFLKCIAQMEAEILAERAEDAEHFERKKSKGRLGGGAGNGRPSAPVGRPVVDIDKLEAELAAMLTEDAAAAAAPAVPLPVATPADLFGPLEDEEEEAAPVVPSEPTMMAKEARELFLQGDDEAGKRMWRERYYRQKMECRSPAEERQVLVSYIEGLHWVLEYYYRGVASWDWFYPYHYAPMASDFLDLDSITVRFTQGTPFKPFEQLLSVLPASSSKHLPEPFRWLMTEERSPILDFYPVNFDVDMEGKRADWEGVVKIPFIDQHRLLSAARLVTPDMLSAEERSRNELGQIMVFSHDPNSRDTTWCKSTLPQHYADVRPCLSSVSCKPPPPPLPAREKGFLPQLVPGTEVGIKNPLGFPTLQTMQVTPEVKMGGINVFGAPARKPSMFLKLRDLQSLPNAATLTAAEVAKSALGERCYVKWPYLQEANICGISDHKEHVTAKGSKPHPGNNGGAWKSQATAICNTLQSKTGVDVGRCDLLLHVKVCTVYVRNTDGTLEKRFADEEVIYPLQAVLRVHPLEQTSGGVDFNMPKLTFKPGMNAVYVGQKYYGCLAKLDSATEVKATARTAATQNWVITVQPPPPQLEQAQQQVKRVLQHHVTSYMPSGQVARKLGVSPRTLGKITGNIWVVDTAAPSGNRRGDDRMDLGIAVKNASKGLCVPGYSAPLDGNSGWGYSSALVQVLQQHRQQFAWVWDVLDKFADASPLDLAEVFPKLTAPERKAKVEAVKKWLGTTALAKRPLVKTSVQMVSDEALLALQVALPPVMGRLPASVELSGVTPPMLLPPHDAGEMISQLAGGEFDLGDRVACLSSRGAPPFGARGTVIGIHEEACEVLFDEEFNGGTTLSGRLRRKTGLAVLKVLLLNLARPKPVAAARPVVQRKSTKVQPVKPGSSSSSQNTEPHRPTGNADNGAPPGLEATPVGSGRGQFREQPAAPAVSSSQRTPPPYMLSVSELEGKVEEAPAAVAANAVLKALCGTPAPVSGLAQSQASDSVVPPSQSVAEPTAPSLGLNLLRQLQASAEKPASGASSSMPSVSSKAIGVSSPRAKSFAAPPGLAPPGFGGDSSADMPPGLSGPAKAGSPAVTALAKPAQEAAAAALRAMPLQTSAAGGDTAYRAQSLTEGTSPAAVSAAVASATRFMPQYGDGGKVGGNSSLVGPARQHSSPVSRGMAPRMSDMEYVSSGGTNGFVGGSGGSFTNEFRRNGRDISPPPGCFEPPSGNGPPGMQRPAVRTRQVSETAPKGSPRARNDGPTPFRHTSSPREDMKRWTSDPSTMMNASAILNANGSGGYSPRSAASEVGQRDAGKASPTKAEPQIPGRNTLRTTKSETITAREPRLPEPGTRGFTVGRGKPVLRTGPPVADLVAPGSMPPLSALRAPAAAAAAPTNAGPLGPGAATAATNGTAAPLLQPAPGVSLRPGGVGPGLPNPMLSPPSAAGAAAGVRAVNNTDLAQNLLGKLQLSGADASAKAVGAYSSVQVPPQPGPAVAKLNQGFMDAEMFLQPAGSAGSSAPQSARDHQVPVSSGAVSPLSQSGHLPGNIQNVTQALAENPQLRQMLMQQAGSGTAFLNAAASNSMSNAACISPAASAPQNLSGQMLLQKIQAAAVSANLARAQSSQQPSPPSLSSPTGPIQLLSPRVDAPRLLQPAAAATRSTLLQPAAQHLQLSVAPNQVQLANAAQQPPQSTQTATLQALHAALLANSAAAQPARSAQQITSPTPAQPRPLPACFLQPGTQPAPQTQPSAASLASLTPLLSNNMQQTVAAHSQNPLSLLLSSPLAAPAQPAQSLHLAASQYAANSAVLMPPPSVNQPTMHTVQQMNMNTQGQSSALLNILRNAQAHPPQMGGGMLPQGVSTMQAHTSQAGMPSIGQQLLQHLQRGGGAAKQDQLLGTGHMSGMQIGVNPTSVSSSMQQNLALAALMQQQQQQQQQVSLQPSLQSLLGGHAQASAVLQHQQQHAAHPQLVGGMHPSSAAALPKETLLALIQRGQVAGANAGGYAGLNAAGLNAGGNIPAVHAGYNLGGMQPVAGPHGFHHTSM